MTDDGRTTWVLIDGENIDATLGSSILGRRPQPDERPRWDRILAFLAAQWNQKTRGLFLLNASTNALAIASLVAGTNGTSIAGSPCCCNRSPACPKRGRCCTSAVRSRAHRWLYARNDWI